MFHNPKPCVIFSDSLRARNPSSDAKTGKCQINITHSQDLFFKSSCLIHVSCVRMCAVSTHTSRSALTQPGLGVKFPMHVAPS